jgi:hypothetical protein
MVYVRDWRLKLAGDPQIGAQSIEGLGALLGFLHAQP